MLRTIVLVVLVLASSCSRKGSSTAPGPTAPGDPAATIELSGRVTGTVTGEALSGLSLDLNGLATTTDASGTFRYEWTAGTRPTVGRLTLDGPGIIPRSLFLATSTTRSVALDAVATSSGFNLDYYRRLVRNAVDQPTNLQPLRRWTRAPRVYLKTVDEQGVPIDAATLDAVATALGTEPDAWTGGRFGIEEIVRGTDSRENVRGWVTVKWINPLASGICAQAQIAVDGGWIELNYLNARCGCNGSSMGPGIVRHEFGHAMGFYHTNEPGDILTAQLDFATACSGRVSARERLHAAVAYSRVVGNLDPDSDPGGSVQSHAPARIVIVD